MPIDPDQVIRVTRVLAWVAFVGIAIFFVVAHPLTEAIIGIGIAGVACVLAVVSMRRIYGDARGGTAAAGVAERERKVFVHLLVFAALGIGVLVLAEGLDPLLGVLILAALGAGSWVVVRVLEGRS